MKIRYTLFQTDFGEGLLAAHENALVALHIGEDAQVFAQNLLFEFPKAGIQRDDVTLTEWVEQVQDYLAGDITKFSMPVDAQGTDFQQAVWQVIQEIPYGETRAYGQITASIGKSAKTIRAAGSAVGANPIAFVIPCHRVLREDGALGGYRWGLALKDYLLKLEKRV